MTMKPTSIVYVAVTSGTAKSVTATRPSTVMVP